MRADRRRLVGLMFRFLESALSLARAGSELRISAVRKAERAILAASWSEAPPPEHTPFSRPELGLLIAQAGWQQAGAEWQGSSSGHTQTCTIQMDLVSPWQRESTYQTGEVK